MSCVTQFRQNNLLDNETNYQRRHFLDPGGGYSKFQVAGMIKGFFGGLRFSIQGFFKVGKFGQVFFWILDLGRDFFGCSKVVFPFFVLYHLMLCGNFYGQEIHQGIFWGLNFGPEIFLGFDFCPHSIIPVT